MYNIFRYSYQAILWSLLLIILFIFSCIGYIIGLELEEEILGLLIGFGNGLIISVIIFGFSLTIINLDKNIETIKDYLFTTNKNIEYIKEIYENKKIVEKMKEYFETIKDNQNKTSMNTYDQNGQYKKSSDSIEEHFI